MSPNGIYEIVLPTGYVLENDQDMVVVFNQKNGHGAMNITSYKIPDDYHFDLEKEVLNFNNSIDGVDSDQNLGIQLNNGRASANFRIGDKFWKVWVFYKNFNAVFVTYNCNSEDAQYEEEDIEKIIQSLKIVN